MKNKDVAFGLFTFTNKKESNSISFPYFKFLSFTSKSPHGLRLAY